MRVTSVFALPLTFVCLVACGGDGGSTAADGGVAPSAAGVLPAGSTTPGLGVLRGAWWRHPAAANQSRLISVEENDSGDRGYNVYNAEGESIRVDSEGTLSLFSGNGVAGPVDVDVIYNFAFADGPGTLVLGADAGDGTLDLLEMDEVVGDLRFPTGTIGNVPGLPVDTTATLTGVCGYRSGDKFYAFVLAGTEILMYDLFQNRAENPSGTLVRQFESAAPASGCVVDGQLGNLHVAIGAMGIQTFEAGVSGSADGTIRNPRNAFFGGAVDVDFYQTRSRGGHLLVASRDDGVVAILNGTTLEYVQNDRFAGVPTGDVQPATRTTGVSVINAEISTSLAGAVAVVDASSGVGTSFVLTSWGTLTGNFTLAEDQGFDPRLER